MIDPMDIDPDTNKPYANFSSDSLDTSFHDHEMDMDDPPLSFIEEQIRNKIASFDDDPPDTNFQRGYLAALKELAR